MPTPCSSWSTTPQPSVIGRIGTRTHPTPWSATPSATATSSSASAWSSCPRSRSVEDHSTSVLLPSSSALFLALCIGSIVERSPSRTATRGERCITGQLARSVRHHWRYTSLRKLLARDRSPAHLHRRACLMRLASGRIRQGRQPANIHTLGIAPRAESRQLSANR